MFEEIHQFGGFQCTVRNWGIHIVKYTGDAPEVLIPDQIDGVPVVSIGSDAFFLCTSQSITIPESVVVIEEKAFSFCDSAIYLESGNEQYEIVDDVLFDRRKKMLHTCLLRRKESSYTAPEGTAIIEEDAFFSHSHVTNVTLPGSVRHIGSSAFSECGLTSIEIPEGVVSVGKWAFANCGYLTSISFPGSVETIGEAVLSNCERLTSIQVNNDRYTAIDYVLFDKMNRTLLAYPGGNPMSAYSVPRGIYHIAERAFCFCPNLVELTLPDSIVHIVEDAFIGCDNLILKASNKYVARYAEKHHIKCENCS